MTNEQANATAMAPPAAERRAVLTPRVDILDEVERWVLVADMPGVDPQSVEVTLERGVLTIAGQKSTPAPEDFDLVFSEQASGDYRRSFTLGDEADAEGVTAVVKHGVLRVEIPKRRPSQKKIDIQLG